MGYIDVMVELSWLKLHWLGLSWDRVGWVDLGQVVLHCTIRNIAQLVRRYQRKRNSEKSEMVTYKDAVQVVRYRCVNEQVKKVYSRAVFLLHAVKTNLFWGITSLDYKHTNTNIINQASKLNELNCTLSFCFSISLTTEECASKCKWRYLQIVNLFWA